MAMKKNGFSLSREQSLKSSMTSLWLLVSCTYKCPAHVDLEDTENTAAMVEPSSDKNIM